MTTPRMRTLDQTIAQLRQDDPNNCLTRHALRQMVLSGQVPYIRAGAKYLVNYDGLLSVLAGGIAPTEQSQVDMCRIRRIGV